MATAASFAGGCQRAQRLTVNLEHGRYLLGEFEEFSFTDAQRRTAPRRSATTSPLRKIGGGPDLVEVLM